MSRTQLEHRDILVLLLGLCEISAVFILFFLFISAILRQLGINIGDDMYELAKQRLADMRDTDS